MILKSALFSRPTSIALSHSLIQSSYLRCSKYTAGKENVIMQLLMRLQVTANVEVSTNSTKSNPTWILVFKD